MTPPYVVIRTSRLGGKPVGTVTYRFADPDQRDRFVDGVWPLAVKP